MMEIEEYFDFKKVLIVDRNCTDSHSHIDISYVKEDNEKLDKGVRGLLSFFINSGFEAVDIMTILMSVIGDFTNHPDNEDFSIKSIVEEHVNNEKEYNEFIKQIEAAEENSPLLRDVFRSWVITHLKQEENSD
jgi:hypothetical protein